MNIKPFVLERLEDETGVSGTGIVAEGVLFSTGKIALTWLTRFRSTTIYDSMEDVMQIHGHGGKTRLVWQVPQEVKDALVEERKQIIDVLNTTMENNGGLVTWEKLLWVIGKRNEQ